jgi:hypothetical protein
MKWRSTKTGECRFRQDAGGTSTNFTNFVVGSIETVQLSESKAETQLKPSLAVLTIILAIAR